MKLRNIILPACLAFQALTISAQEKAPENWFNLDKGEDNVMGVSTEKAYKELLKGKKSQTNPRAFGAGGRCGGGRW